MNKDGKILDKLVEEMVKEHKGGEKFFDNLDEAVRDETYLYSLLDLVYSQYYKELDGREIVIIVSGKFGRFMVNHTNLVNDFSCIVVNGGLRVGEPIDDLSYFDLTDTDFIFLDDSFYSGRTRDIIKEALSSYGAKLLDTFVIYDGSKEKESNVHSLYRYYDKFEPFK